MEKQMEQQHKADLHMRHMYKARCYGIKGRKVSLYVYGRDKLDVAKQLEQLGYDGLIIVSDIESKEYDGNTNV